MTDTDLDRARGMPASADDDLPLLTRLNARGFRLVQAADLLAIVAILVGSMWVRHGWNWPTYPMVAYYVSFAVITGLFLATFYFSGLYEREPRLGAPPVLPRALQATLAAGGLTAMLILVATGAARELGFTPPGGRALPIPIPNLLALIVLGALATAANRRLAHRLRSRREGPPKVLLVGSDADIEMARKHVLTDPKQARIVAAATNVDGLVERVDEVGATDVVLLSVRWLDLLYPDILGELERRSVTVLQRVSAKETMFGLARVRQLGGMPFVILRLHTMPLSRERFKRFTDLVLLSLVAPLAVPIVALVALYVRFVDGPPVLFRQARVGQYGRSFQMVKFRTMTPDAEELTGPKLADADDPRIVPRLRWLRTTRLDELPQLWNVVRGEMSLVGPRPERPEMTSHFERTIQGYARRHEIPPGMTGLAQIHGRYHTDAEYKLGYDLQYLVNWSPVLDLQVLLRTASVVLFRRI